MNSTFYGLLENTIVEVYRREPAYTSSFPMSLSYKGMLPAYARQPLCGELPPGTVEQALQEGITYFGNKWTEVKQVDGEPDPITQFLCDCTIDALCADQGLLALQPHNATGASVAGVLEQEYSKSQTAAGLDYYVRKSGNRPLLLINATGAPISVWHQFLADATHDFRIILPQRRGNDLFKGGLQQHVDIMTDSHDLGAILDAEQLTDIDVLAWCNGARVGIDFANRRAQQISSMVLLAPMLKGIQGVPASPSNFERDLQPLLDAVKKDSSLAPFMAQVIANQPASPDWNRWTNSPGNRAQALFAMPARDHAGAMTAMLTDPQSFINIAFRVATDESYAMDQALRKLYTRTMVIMGSDDGIVSNELVSSAIKEMCPNPITKVVLRGSGHYIHDLQYHYFRWLLNEFLGNHRLPRSTARLEVETVRRLERY